MTQICFNGGLLGFSGYENTNRLYVCGLIESGVDVKVVEQADDIEFFLQFLDKDKADMLRDAILKPIANDYIYFSRGVIDCFKSYPHAVKTFASTVWEVSPCPYHWVDAMNNIPADGIVVPSTFNKHMIEGKVNKPIHLLREGLDSSVYARVNPNKPDGTFNFLSVFQWLPRKGYDCLLEAYFREFNEHDDVSLVIKTSSLNYGVVPSSAILGYIAHIKRKYKKDLPVYITTTNITYDEILELYSNCHAFVLPTRAEGYARPVLEAMTSNLPVIVTGYGGQLDFANNDNAYLIDYQLSPVPPQWYSGDFQSYQVWAEPNIAHLQYLMRHVYENRTEAQEKARKAKEMTLQYDYRLIAQDLKNILFNG